MGFPGGSVVKDLPANAGDTGEAGSLWVGKIPCRRGRQPTPVFLPVKFHGQKSLESYSPQGHRQSDLTEHAHIKCKTSQGQKEISRERATNYASGQGRLH